MKWTNSYRSFGLKTKRSTGLKTIEHKQLMADGQPFSIDVTPDGMTTVTPLTSPKDAAQADGDNAKTGTSPDGARITSRKTLYERFKTKLKANLDERKQ